MRYYQREQHCSSLEEQHHAMQLFIEKCVENSPAMDGSPEHPDVVRRPVIR
jgi:hypothetical protein